MEKELLFVLTKIRKRPQTGMSDFDLKIYVELKFNIGEIWKNTGKPVKTKMLFSNTNKNREFNDFSKYTGKFKQINS